MSAWRGARKTKKMTPGRGPESLRGELLHQCRLQNGFAGPPNPEKKGRAFSASKTETRASAVEARVSAAVSRSPQSLKLFQLNRLDCLPDSVSIRNSAKVKSCNQRSVGWENEFSEGRDLTYRRCK